MNHGELVPYTTQGHQVSHRCIRWHRSGCSGLTDDQTPSDRNRTDTTTRTESRTDTPTGTDTESQPDPEDVSTRRISDLASDADDGVFSDLIQTGNAIVLAGISMGIVRRSHSIRTFTYSG